MKNFSILVLFVLFSLLLLSCEMFTSPVWGNNNRDSAFEGANLEEILSLLKSGQVLSSKDSKAIADFFATVDLNEIDELELEDKTAIVNVVSTGVLPSPSDLIDSIYDDLLNDIEDDFIVDMMDSIITDVVDAVNDTVPTDVLEKIFSDDDTVEALLKESPDALLLGALALTASIAKESGVIHSQDGDTLTVESLYSDTFSAIDEAYQDGLIDGDDKLTSDEEEEVAKILAADLGTDTESVEALLNVVVTVYTVSQEEGLESLGSLESAFNSILGMGDASS